MVEAVETLAGGILILTVALAELLLLTVAADKPHQVAVLLRGTELAMLEVLRLVPTGLLVPVALA
jgi:hypothetical protein